jgi:hypothetical protein
LAIQKEANNNSAVVDIGAIRLTIGQQYKLRDAQKRLKKYPVSLLTGYFTYYEEKILWVRLLFLTMFFLTNIF